MHFKKAYTRNTGQHKIVLKRVKQNKMEGKNKLK